MAGNENKDNVHRANAEWLTREICSEYEKRTRALSGDNAADVGARRELRIELQQRCDISEIEAINILNGYCTGEYISKYERMRAMVEGTYVAGPGKQTYTAEYLEWLAEKEARENEEIEDDWD